MASKPETHENPDLENYAGGWITERKHTNVPPFLRATYIVVGICAVSYLVVQMYGDVSHPDRGSLVEQFNRATMTSPGLMYAIAALAAAFFLAVILFAFRAEE